MSPDKVLSSLEDKLFDTQWNKIGTEMCHLLIVLRYFILLRSKLPAYLRNSSTRVFFLTSMLKLKNASFQIMYTYKNVMRINRADISYKQNGLVLFE